MADQAIAAALPARAVGSGHRRSPTPAPKSYALYRWLLALAVTLLLAAAFVAVTGVRPAYDAYGWLVWGRQAAHLSLNTNSAPSWKPLTFLFTFPYALLFGGGALWAWMVTATAAAFAAPLFAARIAYQLNAPTEGRRYAALAGAAFAGAGVLGIAGYWHFILIATADPAMTALSLAAIDCALAGRPRVAWLLLVLLSLGRPEAAPAVLAYAVWAWWKHPASRGVLVAGLVAIPLLWFGIPALTSESWMIAGDIVGVSTVPLPGNKLDAVMNGFFSLYELPMQLAALAAIALAVLLRLRSWLILAAVAVAWLAVEVALALHGWGITPRYMFEPAAVMVVLAGAGVGRLLSLRPRRAVVLRWLGIAAVAGLVVPLTPHARIRGRLVHNGIVLGRTWARQIHRLHEVIAKEGGPKRILACGHPVTEVAYQSILAWELHQNVIDVGWVPNAWVGLGMPVVVFEPQAAGWQVHTGNAFFSRDPPRCARINATTATS